MKIVKINDSIFREYDIRAIVGIDLNENVAYTIGKSFGTYIKRDLNDKVIVGYDNRVSSSLLNEALLLGLIESGVDVISLGMVTTPMYYYAKKKYNIEAGIMITASHNPKEYNGFKISFNIKGNAYGKFIQDFKDFTNKGVFDNGSGFIEYLNIKNEYIELFKSSLDIKDKVKVVVDCGNGTGSIIIKDILDNFNVEYKLLYCDSDPNFPNHHPDPSVPANQRDLALMVKELGYDIGIGIDGDADRVGIVDENGNILGTDIFMILIYRNLINNMKNKKAIYDVKCSKTLIDELDRLNLPSIMYRTGNSYMNMKINEDDYDFGGEFSGHVWFRDKFPGFDDGIYAGLRAVEILSKTDKTISQLLTGLNKYYSTDELKVEVTDENKFEIVNKVKEYCINKSYKFSDIDGVRIILDNGWALVRASNTGPNLTVRYESNSEEELNDIKFEFDNLIKDIINELN